MKEIIFVMIAEVTNKQGKKEIIASHGIGKDSMRNYVLPGEPIASIAQWNPQYSEWVLK